MNLPATYRAASDPSERRRLQAAAVATFRPAVRALVNRLVPAEQRGEGEQVGAIGTLLALERHATAPGRTFRSTVLHQARGEIVRWLRVVGARS